MNCLEFTLLCYSFVLQFYSQFSYEKTAILPIGNRFLFF